MAANPTAGWRSIVQQVEHVGHPRVIFLVPPAAAGLDADGHLPGVHTSGHEVGLIVVEIPKSDFVIEMARKERCFSQKIIAFPANCV